MKTEQTEKPTLLGSVRGENTGQMAAPMTGETDKEDTENNNLTERTLQEPVLGGKPWTVIDELLEA